MSTAGHLPVDSPWTQSTMRTQYTELVVVEKGVELVAEEMVAEKEGKLVVEAAEGAAEGESVGQLAAVVLRCSGSTRT